MITRQQIEQEIIKHASKDDAFLKQLKENPMEAISEFLPNEVEIPEGVSIKVMQETPTELILRLPFTLSETEELSEDELDSVSAGGYGNIKDTWESDAGTAAASATLGFYHCQF